MLSFSSGDSPSLYLFNFTAEVLWGSEVWKQRLLILLTPSCISYDAIFNYAPDNPPEYKHPSKSIKTHESKQPPSKTFPHPHIPKHHAIPLLPYLLASQTNKTIAPPATINPKKPALLCIAPPPCPTSCNGPTQTSLYPWPGWHVLVPGGDG